VGAGVAFVAFLLTGAVPALVYGGYMGLMLSGVLFGHDANEMLAARVVTGGGMVLGLIATLVLYLVIGAFFGSVAGVALRRLSPQGEEEPAKQPADHT
jgi:hypothetical protein